jgi:D-alanine-D-alanine ligase
MECPKNHLTCPDVNRDPESESSSGRQRPKVSAFGLIRLWRKRNETKQSTAKQPRRSQATGFVLYNRGMDKKRVGIVRGGEGKYYASSLKKGGEIISHISENLSDKYKVVDILVDKAGAWHLNGLPIIPADLFHKVDIVWNTAHPGISVILDNFSIPNIGNGFFSSALENSKDMLREHVKQIGVPMPKYVVSPKNAREVFEKFGSPWRVGNKLVKTFPELEEVIRDSENILVEEFIAGKVASIHSVPLFRGEKIYTFPLGNAFGVFSSEEKEKLANLAKDLHRHIGAKHYLKSNFILDKRGKIYLLDIESTPDLDKDSHFAQVCESVGAQTHQVVEHILEVYDIGP